ncbi:hypothetical protein, partial [Fictibacillus sp. 18YEL24]|uniref:hypothetical protein n=1 Tax=Fictibacillus sp. 18YEL24 TaxID=2745875 RepID=UPI001E3AF5A4
KGLFFYYSFKYCSWRVSSKGLLFLIFIFTIFFEQLVAVEGVRLLRDRRAGETLKSETYECGSPPAPRKAKHLKRKSTTFKTPSENTDIFYNPVTKSAQSFDKFRFLLYMKDQFNDNRSNIQ